MIIRSLLVFTVLGIAAFGAWKLSLSVTPAVSADVPTTTVKKGEVTFTIAAKGDRMRQVELPRSGPFLAPRL